MSAHLSTYAQSILTACALFPFVAGLVTVPFVVVNYRRFGGISFVRVLVVFSFILYLLCAFCLVMLPLPSIASVSAAEPVKLQWIPMKGVYDALTDSGFDFSGGLSFGSLSLWRAFFTSAGLFGILANIAMMMPLGFYLRYYFRCDRKTTVLIGLAVSLFFELTQLTGLYFIYPHAFRCADIDDLFNNTLGSLIGYQLTPAIAWILPKREDIDKIFYPKDCHAAPVRRFAAAGIDWLLLAAVAVAVPGLSRSFSGNGALLVMFDSPVVVVLYFVLLQWLLKGRTVGKLLLRIKTVGSDGKKPPALRQLAVRYMWLYAIAPAIAAGDIIAAAALAVSALGQMGAAVCIASGCVCALTLGLTAWLLFGSLRKWNCFPHSHYSATLVVTDGAPSMARAVSLPQISAA